MNPLLQQALGSIVRWLLTFAAGYLVQLGIWTEEDAMKYVGAAALALVALGWSLYQKYKSRLTLVTALATPGRASEAEVEQKIKAEKQKPVPALPPVTTPKTVVPDRRTANLEPNEERRNP